ncbi:MAG: acetylglutamate kinase, partial [Clostridiales bacterium]|nr:acetylglutamate kinase [Clostridiales bacterium]
DLVALLRGRGVGLCGMDGQMITCSRKSDADLGYVGEIDYVNTTLITHLLDNAFIPVIATLGMDENGVAYNINADTAAAKLAEALHAEKLILLTDVRGLLRDPHDEDTLIHVLHTYEVPELVAQGVISGGMIPKMQCCVDAIAGGVERVHILDGRIPHSILIELLSDEGIGTMLKRED